MHEVKCNGSSCLPNFLLLPGLRSVADAFPKIMVSNLVTGNSKTKTEV